MGSVGVDTPAYAHDFKHKHLPIPILAKGQQYGDFRDELAANGFVVIKGAIPSDRARHYQEKAFDWLRSFNTALDFEDRETWIAENLPLMNKIRAFGTYGVVHEKFMWDARMEPGVLDAFSKLWGTDELLVSFDCLNVTFPNRPDLKARQGWEHTDQSPMKRGVHCIQGIINLSHAGPEDGGLVVFPGSHKLHDEFFDTHNVRLRNNDPDNDVYLFSKDELKWWEERGLRPHKVCAEPGDLILWDSRTIHYGSDPTPKGDVIRTVIYASYMPASLASEQQLEWKKQAFENYAHTTHWAYEHIGPNQITQSLLPDGSRDPRDRDQPLELPEMSEKLLKLSGLKHY
ncbi:hypothetical protein VMCG_10804 [Cytospora schulzeri]|uniref:Phytanoyl-CoA dioxygenase n=1 Tax=Cytospora schulzeri TaxID=448051 RepID=A0A423V7W9_9PEZI|nr:hypothetical protein VMCG_10804 [Valsa malicola]